MEMTNVSPFYSQLSTGFSLPGLTRQSILF
jgi:hypothetical protein